MLWDQRKVRQWNLHEPIKDYSVFHHVHSRTSKEFAGRILINEVRALPRKESAVGKENSSWNMDIDWSVNKFSVRNTSGRIHTFSHSRGMNVIEEKHARNGEKNKVSRSYAIRLKSCLFTYNRKFTYKCKLSLKIRILNIFAFGEPTMSEVSRNK